MVLNFDEYIKEENDPTMDNIKATTDAYNRLKGRVKSFIDPENLSDSREKFEDFLSKLPDSDKPAADLLRKNFTAEAMVIEIENLKQRKKDIDDQITTNMKELQELKSKIQ